MPSPSSLKFFLRDETPGDAAAITEVTAAAFKTLAISRHTEQFIVEALRATGALSVSLVAQSGDAVIGHIAFSPVSMSDGSSCWFGLGPVSVNPGLQRQGIGSALIREGLARLRALDACGCCLVGHPGYYRRFGFENTPQLSLEGVPPEVFFALAFHGKIPSGTVAFHPAFLADRSPGNLPPAS